MFVRSVRATTLKFFAVVCVALVTLITLISFVPTYGEVAVSKNSEISYEKIKTNDDRIEFLRQFGLEVVPDAVTASEVHIPTEFDRFFLEYNEIQKRQGLDLTKYKNKNVMRYTYEVTNYDGYDGTVYVNMIVYRNRVIGGDVASADVTGFIHGFEK
jgi:Na+-translocating ferredoxin:NAD+ oxidoreductase RnfG subunit